MGVLSAIEPRKVFSFFEEITKIPHGSGNVDAISDHLVSFARARGLQVIQDEVKNVIIIKEAAPGYENEPPVILQGHMDMVAVSKPEYNIDMKTEGLTVAVDGDDIYAEGTSLGGDDGIAVAYAMALLDSDDLRHPRLEVVITVNEEVGMDGARAVDLSMLRGNRLLNLDSEEEGIFLTSCAGGARVNCRLEAEAEETEGLLCEIEVGGLSGGHSGAEIHKERGNSNCLFGRVLRSLTKEFPIRLVSVQGGLADNAIPRQTLGTVLIPKESELCRAMLETSVPENTPLDDLLENLRADIAAELAVRDPGFSLTWKKGTALRQTQALSTADTGRAAAFLEALPNGVQAMSAELPGLVETSLNLGVLTCNAQGIVADFSVRSSVESAKYALIGKLQAITELAGGRAVVSGDYPGWKYRADSPLREKMVRVYEKMYGSAPKVEAIHAGLECGILGSKIKDLDCVSIGPDMRNIHTTEETLSISSTKRVWEYLVALLAEKE